MPQLALKPLRALERTCSSESQRPKLRAFSCPDVKETVDLHMLTSHPPAPLAKTSLMRKSGDNIESCSDSQTEMLPQSGPAVESEVIYSWRKNDLQEKVDAVQGSEKKLRRQNSSFIINSPTGANKTALRLTKSRGMFSPGTKLARSPLRHLKRERPISSPVHRSEPAAPCPRLEGMLKAETCGDQRIRNLLYGQSVWVPAYCVLENGVVTCYKDRAHTKCVEAFDLTETRVEASCKAPNIVEFNCNTDHGYVIVDMMAKDGEDASRWIRSCTVARRWAEENQRLKLGLAPLNPAAARLVAVRKMAKKHELELKGHFFLRWLDLANAIQASPRLPVLHHSTTSPMTTSIDRPAGEHARDKVKEAFIPGQLRRLRNVNGKVAVNKAQTAEALDKDMREEERRRREEESKRQEEKRHEDRHQIAQTSLRKRSEELHGKSVTTLQADLVDMMMRFDKLNKNFLEHVKDYQTA